MSVRGARPSFVGAVAAIGAFSVFMLFRPLVGGGAYYGPRPHSIGYSYTWQVLVLFGPYALALAALRRGGVSLRAVVVAAAVVTAPLVVAPLTQSQDLYQYLFYARMQVVHGANPYTLSPRAFSSDAWFRFLAWPKQRSVYGPLWSLLMASVIRATGGSLVRALLAAKALAVGFEGLTVWGLARVSLSEREPYATAAFALNPLVLSTVALSGHADAAVAAAFVWAVVADRGGRSIASSLLLAGATLVKAYAGLILIVYLVVLWRRDGGRTAARAAAASLGLATVAFAPYWSGIRTLAGTLLIAGHTSSSLAGAVQRALGSALAIVGVSGWAGVAATSVRVAAALAMVAALALLARSPSTATRPWPAAMAVLALYLFVTPWFLPWHALGLLALACAIPESGLSTPAIVFSGSCLAAVGSGDLAGVVATALARYAPPAFTGLVVRSRRRARDTEAPTSGVEAASAEG